MESERKLTKSSDYFSIDLNKKCRICNKKLKWHNNDETSISDRLLCFSCKYYTPQECGNLPLLVHPCHFEIDTIFSKGDSSYGIIICKHYIKDCVKLKYK